MGLSRLPLSGVTEDRGATIGRILSFVLRVLNCVSLTKIIAKMSEFPMRCSLDFAVEEVYTSMKETNSEDLVPLSV